MISIEKSYKKILEEIKALRKTINDSLDQLEIKSKQALDTLLATMRTSIQTDIENCTKSTINIICVKEDWLRIKDKSEALSFIEYRKCRDQSLRMQEDLEAMTTKNEMTLTFNPDTTIKQTLSTLSGLGQILSNLHHSSHVKQPSVTRDPNQVITVTSSEKYKVKEDYWTITGICETASGELIITDIAGNNVELLNQSFTLVDQCNWPFGGP
ncbi:hypothetical protein DPMN_091309 [Dreissena polymorpha]|uniref:Uncharacterized protein n=1 Tax=Dreissena polymorpha TaxID=45954 RepID=A0A9D4QZ45_DREPO|nr:hypothetical protein DPMN_091309 [Dreissena polymorpha]